MRDLIQLEETQKRLPGGGDMVTETWRRSRIWLDGEGWEAERTAPAKVQRHKKNDVLERTAWLGHSRFTENWNERRLAV